MVAVTALISFFFMVVALRSRPGFALAMVIVSALVWAEYLRFPLGVVQMSAPRLVAVALLIKYLYFRRSRRYPISTVDKVVIVLFFWSVISKVMAGATFAAIKSSIGQSLDTVVMFFVARLCLQTKADLKDFALPVVICGAYLGFMGIFEAVTSTSPYQQLFKHHQWNWFNKPPEYRLGLLRARTSTSHYIYSGVSLLIVFGFSYSLQRFIVVKKSQKKFMFLALLMIGIGVFSSLSSGPLSGLFCFLAFSYLYRRKWMIRPIIISVILLCLFIEVASNRHFYNLVDYIALNSTTAWYRTRLIEVAVAQVHEYALFGMGGESPHHWGKLVDGRGHVDLVNNYIYVAVSSGLLGFGLFVYIQVMAIRQAIRLQRYGDPLLNFYGFGIVSIILALMITSMSVGIFGPVLIFSFLLYGAAYIRPDDGVDLPQKRKKGRRRKLNGAGLPQNSG